MILILAERSPPELLSERSQSQLLPERSQSHLLPERLQSQLLPERSQSEILTERSIWDIDWKINLRYWLKGHNLRYWLKWYMVKIWDTLAVTWLYVSTHLYLLWKVICPIGPLFLVLWHEFTSQVSLYIYIHIVRVNMKILLIFKLDIMTVYLWWSQEP